MFSPLFHKIANIVPLIENHSFYFYLFQIPKDILIIPAYETSSPMSESEPKSSMGIILQTILFPFLESYRSTHAFQPLHFQNHVQFLN